MELAEGAGVKAHMARANLHDTHKSTRAFAAEGIQRTFRGNRVMSIVLLKLVWHCKVKSFGRMCCCCGVSY